MVSRIEVAVKMKETGMVPILYHPDINVCKKIVKACYDGGVRAFEFTNRGLFAHEVFAELNKYALKELPGMVLGIGSVVDAPTAALYIQNGAGFIVSPLLNPEIAKVCNRRKVLYVPGCATITEIGNAEELGAEIVKLFPAAQLGGASFVKAVKAPCPWTSIMVTGGVEPTEENLKVWFKAGVTCVGMGSSLFTEEILKNEKYEDLTAKVKGIFKMIHTIRG